METGYHTSRAVKYEPRSSTLLTFVLAFPVDNYSNIPDFSAAVFTRARWPSYRPGFTLACRAYQGDVKLSCASGRRSVPPFFPSRSLPRLNTVCTA
jgi:hypothetical protein